MWYGKQLNHYERKTALSFQAESSQKEQTFRSMHKKTSWLRIVSGYIALLVVLCMCSTMVTIITGTAPQVQAASLVVSTTSSAVQNQSSVQPLRTGVNGNPWGYDFRPGKRIYKPASAFCHYFRCVTTFWNKTNGYVAECHNGKYTHSDGVRGACSRDGGVWRLLYSH